eukprot:TRINITY_DN39004_c0_g1_i1.p1 TRINITY_DN39004_c0_g1~~TRINITY_DN39004_c0_g1_i1.p1  ORF type:complete len:706 (+),score=85.65 TRINITY_DN39004_c0_g1_i1:271-2118(+)
MSGEVMRQIVEWLRVPVAGDDVVRRRLVYGQHPFTKLWAQAVRGQNAFGEGGWLLMHVSLHIIQARSLDIVPASLVDVSISVCKQWCKAFLFSPDRSFKLSLSDTRTLLTVAAGSFTSNPLLNLTQDDAAIAASKVVRAFLTATNDTTYNPACLRVHKIKSPHSRLDVNVVDGVIIDWGFPQEYLLYGPSDAHMKIVGGRIALYDLCIEPDVVYKGVGGGQDVVATGEVNDVDSMENLKKVLNALKDAGVRIVGSQKTIHWSAKVWLAKNGILPLERLSNRHIDAVRLAAGGYLITNNSVQSLEPTGVFGELLEVSEITLGNGKKRVKIVGKSSPVTTILLSHPYTQILDEAERVVHRAAASLVTFMKHPVGSPGAGVTESTLSRHLQLRSRYVERCTTGVLGKLSMEMRECVKTVIGVVARGFRDWGAIVVGGIEKADEVAAANEAEGEEDAIIEDMNVDPLVALRLQRTGLKPSKRVPSSEGVSPNAKNPLKSISETLLRPTPHPVTTLTLLHGCPPPPGSTFHSLRTYPPGSLPPPTPLAAAYPPRVFYSYRAGIHDIVPVCKQLGTGGLDTWEGTHLPVVDNTAGKYQAICSALDIAAMLLRTDSLVIDTT